MKKSLLLSIFLLTAAVVFAQFNMQPSTSSVSFQEADFDVHADSRLIYNGSVPVVLRWEIVNLSGPKEWGIYTCLGLACYSPGQYVGLQTIQPNEEMIVQAHILPQTVCGTGSYDITFTDTTTNQVVATGTFTFQCQSVSTSNPASAKPGAIFPNPAITWFSIGDTPGAHRVEMFNIIGKQVAQFPYQPSGRYDIAQLPGGMYLVRVVDLQGRVLSSKRMSKNTP